MLNIWTDIDEIVPVIAISKSKNEDDALFWAQKGYQMSKDGNIDNSIDYYTEGHKLDPDNYMISYNLGCIFVKIW